MSAGETPKSKLQAVGYWRTFMEPWTKGFPSPRWCVDASWLPHERERIVDYLNRGVIISGSCSYSYCRFHCGIDCEDMGSCDLSDGTWMWPQGLAHYVEAHAVKLPDGFIHTMRMHEWQPPPEFVERVRAARVQPPTQPTEDRDQDFPRSLEEMFDYGPWREWAKQLRPWYVFW